METNEIGRKIAQVTVYACACGHTVRIELEGQGGLDLDAKALAADSRPFDKTWAALQKKVYSYILHET
jgi:hypothetical protein